MQTHTFAIERLLTVLALCLFSVNALAQEPKQLRYQVTVTDENDKLVTNKEVTVRLSVFKSTQDGPAVFTEIHKTATDTNGLASFVIGQGSELQGTLAGIDLANDSFVIRTAIVREEAPDKYVFRIARVQRVAPAVTTEQPQTSVSPHPDDSQKNIPGSEAITSQKPSIISSKPGVPSQTWSLFGNSNSDPSRDKLGTTDDKDLVIVTNNLDRFRIAANGDINLARSLEIGNDLRVNRNVDLNILGGATVNNGNLTVKNASATSLTGTLTVDGATNLNNSLRVNNAALTRLTGPLTTDGVTNLNNSLSVNNLAPTGLTGSLTVDGAATLKSSLTTNGATNLNSSLNVNNGAPTHLTGSLTTDGFTLLKSSLTADGTTNLNSFLNVNNGARTHLTGALDVDQSVNIDGATTLQSTVTANGQVTIIAAVSGGDASYGAHPLRVEGSEQGIAIKLKKATPDNANNFVTFFNGSGSPVGRIEGQTIEEVATSAEFLFQNSVLVATEATAIANTISAAIPVVVGGVGASTGPCTACLVMAAADLVLATANLAGYNAFALTNLGVTYESGSADYAEWLERSDPYENISAGDIVAVNGGKISRLTFNSKQFMVVSTKPAMLGNMPPAGQSDLYEKVAFMGQVPVKVRGIVMIGDYILPSGFNDGTGIAVSRDAIASDQYSEIVGVAWSPCFVGDGISTINMAIGLSSNEVANLTARQEKKLKALENKLNALERRLLGTRNGPGATSETEATDVLKVTEQSVKREKTRSQVLASSMPAELSGELMEQAISYLKNAYTSRGLSFKDHPALNRLFTDAVYKAEIIRKTQERYKLFYQGLLAQ